jgi:hypothetical protein
LQKCAKLRKESDAANHALATKPSPAKETKAQAAKDLYEQHVSDLMFSRFNFWIFLVENVHDSSGKRA